ncbi:MAG: hypothetical protein LBG06_09995, partial [Deltaproteobacteria bacterium]|nr:hypothetical protein [Deltaproteobacteria bacterium]
MSEKDTEDGALKEAGAENQENASESGPPSPLKAESPGHEMAESPASDKAGDGGPLADGSAGQTGGAKAGDAGAKEAKAAESGAGQAAEVRAGEVKAAEVRDSEGKARQPVSQAVQDLADMDEGQLKELKDAKAPKDAKAGENVYSPRDLVWLFLLVLNEVFLALWLIGTILADRPYEGLSVAVVGLFLVLSFPLFKWLRIPTKAGLAFLGTSVAFTVSSLHNPEVTNPGAVLNLLPGLPFALIWSLTLSALWVSVLVSSLRLFGLRKHKLSIVPLLLLLYPAIGLFSALVSYFGGMIPQPWPGFTFGYLNQSPFALTTLLPWFIEPAIFFDVLLPLAAAAVFFRYEIKVLSDTAREGKHHAGLYLGLGCLFLTLAGFMFDATSGRHVQDVTGAIQRSIPSGNILVKSPEEAPVPAAPAEAAPAPAAPTEAAP